MAKQQENNGGASGKELLAVETLRARFGTPTSVYFGMTTMKGWNAGKRVTEDEYKQALTDFNAARTGKGATNA